MRLDMVKNNKGSKLQNVDKTSNRNSRYNFYPPNIIKKSHY